MNPTAEWVPAMHEQRTEHAQGQDTIMSDGARTPEDITRLFVERANAGDADGVADLYEEDAILAFPPGTTTVGRTAIREWLGRALANSPTFEPEEPLPTLVVGDLALTGTPSSDEKGMRVQVVRRQADGTWRRVIDRPEAG
jgi:ketosteroid isomerase-like protein